MKEQVKVLCEDFDYEKHELSGDLLSIYVKLNHSETPCPYRGTVGKNVHSQYERSLRDLPIQGKKVEIVVHNIKYLSKNPACDHTTSAKTYRLFAIYY